MHAPLCHGRMKTLARNVAADIRLYKFPAVDLKTVEKSLQRQLIRTVDILFRILCIDANLICLKTFYKFSTKPVVFIKCLHIVRKYLRNKRSIIL